MPERHLALKRKNMTLGEKKMSMAVPAAACQDLPPDLKTAHWRHMFLRANPHQGQAPPLTHSISQGVRTPVYAACAAAVLAVLILLALSPPFVQKRTPHNDIERGQLDITRLLGWGAAVFAVVLLLPLFLA